MKREQNEEKGVERGESSLAAGWGVEGIGRVVCCGLLRLGRDSSTPTIAD